MMSTVGLELLNFINPDLTWKTVAKGYRSNSRRKPACRNFTMGKLLPDKDAKKFDDATISDTEKNGVDVLGRHFSDKVEHVPIKKRRFLCPPKQSPSSRYKLIETNSLSKRQRRASDVPITAKFTRNKKEVMTEDMLEYDEDFSGIEILAAVACDNGMVNDTVLANSSLVTESAEKGIDSSTPALLGNEVVDIPKDVVTSEERIEVSSLCEGEDTSIQKSANAMHDVPEKVAKSSRVHWDLNVTMDAWETPCSIPSEDPSTLTQCDTEPSVDKPPEDFGIRGEPNDMEQNMSENLKDLPTCSKFSQKRHYHEASSILDVNHVECDPSPVDGTRKCSVGEVDNVKTSDQLNGAACLKVAEHRMETFSSTVDLSKRMEVSMPNIQLSETSVDKAVVHLESCNDASQSTMGTEKVICETDCVTSKRDEELSCQPESLGCLGIEPVKLAEHVEDLQFSPAQGTTSTSSPVVLEGQPVNTAITQGQADAASPTNAAEVESPAHDGSEEMMQKSSVDSTATHSEACGAQCRGPFGSLTKAIAEEPSEGNYESDVHQADKLPAVSGEDMTGYDSQFEDGELRESDARYHWDENEDYADCVSEEDEERLCDGDRKEKNIQRGLRGDPDIVSKVDHQGGKGGCQRDDSASPRTRNSDVSADKDFPSGIGRLRAPNRESQSCNGRHDGIRGKDSVVRSRTENGSIYHRDEREASSRRFIEMDRAACIRGRSPGGRRFVSPSVGYWDSERRSSPLRGTYTSGASRPKNVLDSRCYMMPLDHMDSEASNVAGFDTRPRRNFVNVSSSGQYERFARRRTPNGRDEGYTVHRAMLPAREISPGRNNFGRYHEGIGREMRSQYQRSVPEDNIEYPNRHRFVRRERSISPLRSPIRRGRRALYSFQYKKSRSRSRSRSPTGYLLPRERNTSQRFRSRSPEFRSNGRMDRGRMPLQKRLQAEYDEGFMSPPRGRFSPQHNTRCFDDRNGTTLDSFRGRRSPVRTFRQSQRFESEHSFRRLNSDAPYRLTVHSRKLTDANRRSEYDGSGDDDRRKGRDRYEMVHRVRRYDSDGVVRRFRYNPEDSFVDNETHNFDECNKKLTDRRLRDVATNRASEE